MKYYVVSDIHSFCTILKETLETHGYFSDPEPHKLIVCGDLFDRGPEPEELTEFILDLMRRDEVILVRGNHEDLLLKMLDSMDCGKDVRYTHHQSNGTVGTVQKLTQKGSEAFVTEAELITARMRRHPVVTRIIPSMIDYFETEHYIFVHGWLPCYRTPLEKRTYSYHPIENWRSASSEDWAAARWVNGMDAAHHGILCEKTVVCGHYHTSFGHALFEGKGSEYDEDADFSPFYANGIIAIDACTAHSKQMNCLVLEDDPAAPFSGN